MFKLLKLPFKLLSLIVTGIVLLLILSAVLYLQPWVKQYIPDSVQGFSGYTSSVTTCMVKKSWDKLSPDSQQEIQKTGSVANLPTAELKKLHSSFQECK